ncbi:unnamed protein product [Clonostachys solani]|uniref:Carrier domain-containing protein n=1 Tax=Clonostachys solani TaxID=160281 RepID=A0A9P0EK78_9HYPO|nr:unnamed protein product [Clonostachys solani]
MPFLRGSASPSPEGTEARSEASFHYRTQNAVVDDDTYAEFSLPGSTEKPLSEQLEPVAVVGMGCRLPGDVKSASDFWELMMSKGTGQTPKVPESRFKIDAHIHENNDRPGSFNVLGGYFLNESLEQFDPSCFNITPIEAMWMDPQQRKLLEVVYESFESAGVTLDTVSGSKTAVFAASFTADFQQMAFKEPAFRHSLAATGVDPGILSNRISHVFNLKGPSIVVNTACSSSVYALHNACNAIRNKECVAAVVGGVNLVMTVDQHMNTAKLGVLSPTSTCRTAVGDPLEVNAVSMAMNQQRTSNQDPLMIGAVKTSIGHSEAASGLSALIKAVLSVERGIIPPTRGVVNPSPAIKWKEWMVTVPTEPTPFPDLPLKRFSINSFGYGGTNAHVVVESADALLTRKQTYKYLSGERRAVKSPRGAFNRSRPYLFVFSAHDKSALERNFTAHSTVAKSYDFLDLAYTLGNRRTVFPTRGFTSSLVPFDMPLSTDAKMVSSVVNATIPSGTLLDETYFSRNLRQPVLFNQAIQTILTKSEFSDVNLLIEVGPHGALGGPVRQIKQELEAAHLDYLPTMVRGQDSAMQMLKLAGELFLRDYPLDIDRVTSIEETTSAGKVVCRRGDLVVDLPPYQWGKKSYWAEARHSVEHRQPKYPRHDVLGSLIPGASLAEPTWRNFLRIRDLPWLKDHSLGGEAVFPAAAYFSMAMEAVTQITELHDPDMEVNSYVLRDISIKKALVTPEDDTGIEVLMNMRPATFSGDGSWWEFNVSSINQEGITTDHMTGSISANMKTQRPAPRARISLSQQASGKEWNQALRSVGFDYGPVFADMADIGFNGRDYIWESRHVLHPGTVDSCLQLMITSIYAGRTKAMAAAIAPIQVDEVCIWKPTEEQIGDGFATAWVDDRGIRSFVCGNELVSNNGEVLMQMSNMRGTLYEAAVPQSSSTALKPMPYSETVWKEDLESLIKIESAETLAELATFKNPGIKVLDVGGKHAVTLLQTSPELNYTAISENPAPEGLIEKYPSAEWKLVDMQKDLAEQGLVKGSFDVTLSEPNSVSAIKNLMTDDGSLFIARGKNFELSVSPEVESSNEDVIEVQILYRQVEASLLSEVKRSLADRGYKATPISLKSLDTVQPHVVLLDLDEPILFGLSEHEFNMIKKVSNEAKTLLWASAGGLLNGKRPAAGMIAGLVRSIRAERATINIVTIDFDLETTSIDQAVKFVAQKSQHQIEDGASVEHEYCVSDDKLYISRLLPNNALNREQTIEELPYDPEMHIGGTVQNGKVLFEQQVSRPELSPDSVEIRVSVTGLSKEGVLAVHGTDISTTLNHEVGGTVERIGSSVKNFAVGDRVIGLGSGRFGNRQVISKNLVQKLLPGESLAEVVSLPLAYITALHGLESLASLKKGETLLILEGTGFGGAAAIEVALTLGAIPYVVASTEEQASTIIEKYGLAQHQVLSSASQVEAMLATPHRTSKVDVVFSSGMTPESSAREAWRYISRFGRYIECGKKLVLKRGSRDPVPFYRGASYFSFDVVELYEHKPSLVSHLLHGAIDLYRKSKISPLGPLNVVNISDLNKAISRFDDGIGSGKTLISYEPSETPLVILPSLKTTTLDAAATYLLVGCLGGLGRSLTAWMMEKDARNFCFLSRSGADAPAAARLITDLETAGAHVDVVRGDVSVQADVRRAVAAIPSDRPLRGVIQAAMVLRDGMFQNMTFQDWVTSTKPKVHGTANLQAVLGDMPLDFFLMTSSVSGTLGTPGQANYAAGNAFLDALAHYRRARGQNACAAVVPMVLGVGVVAESTDLEDALTRKGMYGIDEEHLLRSFDIAIREQQRPDGIHQLVIGLDPTLLSRAINNAEQGHVDPFWMADKRFRSLVHNIEAVNGGVGVGSGSSALGSMLSAATPDEAIKLARDEIVGKLSRMLLLDLEVFDGDSGSIASYGIDSMIGAELRNWLFKEFALEIPFQQLLGPTLTTIKLARQLCVNHGILEE